MIKRRPLRVLFFAEPESLEVFLGLTMLVFGVWLTLFSGANTQFGHGYDWIAHLFGSRHSVGLTAIGLGGLQAVSALYMLPRVLRSATDALCAIFYGLISSSMISFEWRSTGVPVYSMLALAHAWVAWRERRTARGY